MNAPSIKVEFSKRFFFLDKHILQNCSTSGTILIYIYIGIWKSVKSIDVTGKWFVCIEKRQWVNKTWKCFVGISLRKQDHYHQWQKNMTQLRQNMYVTLQCEVEGRLFGKQVIARPVVCEFLDIRSIDLCNVMWFSSNLFIAV